MRMHLLFFLLLCITQVSFPEGDAYGSARDGRDFEIIRERIIRELMEAPVRETQIDRLIKTLREEGSWPGINYADTSRTGFQHSDHMDNLLVMSRAYQKKDSRFFQDKQLKAAVSAALDYWLARDFICENWWWNQIGIPDRLVNILLIMGKDNFTPRQWEGALRIAGRAHLEASGARPSGDRIVIAGILAKKLLAAGDREGFNAVIRVIEEEIRFSTGRGMQHDYSFHHRDDCVNNTLSYGTSYAGSFSEWAAYVAGTSYAFSEASLRLLTDYYLDGICKMLAFGKYPDPGAKNRGITRSGALRALGTGIPRRLLEAGSHRARELKRIVSAREGRTGRTRPHTTFFWRSEYLSHQRPEYFTSVRMFSTRNHNMEIPYNGEGLLNHYLGNGANFLSRTGSEYLNIFPVFDYHKIPGATLVQYPSFPDEDEIQQAGITDFAGGLTDGTLGVAAFDFKSTHDSIQARKAWFFLEGVYACLGAGISSPAGSPVVTTINQCHLRPGTVISAGGKQAIPEKGAHILRQVSWVWHDSIGYVFPYAQDVHLSNQAQTGSWYRINRQANSSREQLSQDVFKLWINHGQQPDSAAYAYFVLPGASKEDIARFGSRKDIRILENTARLQAVEDTGKGIVQLVCYAPASITASQNFQVKTGDPGILMIRKGPSGISAITVSDPSRKLDTFRFSVSMKIDASGAHFTARWNPEKKQTELSVKLPRGVYAGKSVTIAL